MNKNQRTQELIDKLDGSGSIVESAAVKELRKLDVFPKLLLEKYRSSQASKVRTACVYHAMVYAPTQDDAVTLGKEALGDKSKTVRYRACMLLAYSQKKEALLALNSALAAVKSADDAEHIRAAIDAIKSRNHNYFVDRDHTGKFFLEIL